MTTTVDSHPADTSLLQTPHHCRQEKKMTETNSCYYGLSLLRKCGKFHAPQRDNSLVFSLTLADTEAFRPKS